MTSAVTLLKQKGFSQYLLEVIRINIPALQLYKKIDFEITREFDYYLAPTNDIRIDPSKLGLGNNRIVELEGVDWDLLRSFWDFNPSWQNSIESLTRKLPHFSFISLQGDDGTLLAYAILEKETGDVPQFAVAKGARRRGCGTVLLSHLASLAPGPVLRFINLEADYIPFKLFMEKCNIKPGHGQYEMMRIL